ncbi:MAG: gliding motility-associated C-terminal domain-containing protein, partial [Chitinophagaceae bacterium]|nr:gliding motility-associated C-terminal domain-containing protein [Chitinophagaceae bacterium]
NDIYIPTAFTPNNDGRNDQLKPYFPGTILLKDFSIFNRWGNRIFTTSQRGFGWDGKVNGEFQPAGVYVWSFQAFDEKTQKSVIRKGVVTLIR